MRSSSSFLISLILVAFFRGHAAIHIAMVQPPTADPCKNALGLGYADPTMDLPHFDALLRHDAILSNTPSRRIRPWKRAAPKWARNVKKSK
jgi:hypothetical protein